MVPGWDGLSEFQQLEMAREALRAAVDALSIQADTLADEMDCGLLPDRGGPEALRLLACLMRLSCEQSALASLRPVGQA
jgi:hypothetical protein